VGYDMQMLRRPEPIPEGYRPQYAVDPGYFRVVQRGMPVLSLFMSLAGVLDEDEEGPAFPVWPPAGIADAPRADALFTGVDSAVPPATDAEREAMRSWEERAEVVRRTPSRFPDRVPAFKFRLQMDWVVSDEEARTIATGMRRALEDEPEVFEIAVAHLPAAGLSGDEALDWIRRWARFNEVAADNGGYRIG
jgi:hypothetical protein